MAKQKHSYRCTYLTYERFPRQFSTVPACDCGADLANAKAEIEFFTRRARRQLFPMIDALEWYIEHGDHPEVAKAAMEQAARGADFDPVLPGQWVDIEAENARLRAAIAAVIDKPVTAHPKHLAKPGRGGAAELDPFYGKSIGFNEAANLLRVHLGMPVVALRED